MYRPIRRFFKKITYDCNIVLDNKVPGEKVQLVSKTAVPQQFCQKKPELGKNGIFWCFG